MKRKGSITIFLTLTLSLMLSLICTSLESVRMAAARTQILSSLDIGLYSLFGQYDRVLLNEYDLFLLDGSGTGEGLGLSRLYDSMESYIEPVLKQNSQKLSLVQGGFTGYRLATDEDGEAFYQQVVRYMKETLGFQGIQLLMDRMRDREQKTIEAEQNGTRAENSGSLESYETEMNAASKNSEEAKKQQQQQNAGHGASGKFSSGSEESPFSSSSEKKVINPITIIRRIRKMGILDLVLPPGKGLSGKEVRKNTLLSGRTLEKGLDMAEKLPKDTSYASQILFQQYLMEKLGNFRNPSAHGLSYEMEYVLAGKDNDIDNLKAAANKLLIIREGINFAHLLADPVKHGQAAGLAAVIASSFLVPPAASVIEGALLVCWAFAESILDVRELLDGGKVPLAKTASTWQLSLENLPNLLNRLDSCRKGVSDGMSYEDYLQVMLMTKSKIQKLKLGMDMVELGIRSGPEREAFRLDSCITAIEASVDVKANRRKVFTATRQYCYD